MNTVQHPNSDVPMSLEERVEHTNTAKYLSAHAYSKMVPSFKFIIENLIRIINDHDRRIGNQNALAFGDGPCLLTSFILAKKVQSIRFTDHSLENLAAVQDWINQKPDAHDWSDLFDRVIHEYHTQVNSICQSNTVLFFSPIFVYCRQVRRQQNDHFGRTACEKQSSMADCCSLILVLTIVLY